MEVRPAFVRLLCLVAVAVVWSGGVQAQSREVAVEVFQVPELPLTVTNVSLVQTEKGYFLRCSLLSSSELKLVGLRYSLVEIDSDKGIRGLANRIEGFALEPYGTKAVKFTVPIKRAPQDGNRLVLMLEQAVARETIWEVIKAKDALDAYAKGDYSVVPRVLRGPDQVDVPLPGRVSN